MQCQKQNVCVCTYIEPFYQKYTLTIFLANRKRIVTTTTAEISEGRSMLLRILAPRQMYQNNNNNTKNNSKKNRKRTRTTT